MTRPLAQIYFLHIGAELAQLFQQLFSAGKLLVTHLLCRNNFWNNGGTEKNEGIFWNNRLICRNNW